MNKFLLSLFVLINILWYDIRIGWNAAYMCVTNLVLKFLVYIANKIKAFFSTIWKFIKWITWPFRHALYEYVVVTFIACLFVTIKYPEWPWTDYSWIVFFFVLMITLLISAIRDK